MKHRMLRVNEVVKRELSGIIAREISFEGALVTVNHVEVSPDLKTAQVFVSVLGSESGESVMKKLEVHRPAFQSELARRVTMKFTPHLVFHLDESIARGSRVVEILQEIESDDRKNA
jgi:ribosome-binding factor A